MKGYWRNVIVFCAVVLLSASVPRVSAQYSTPTLGPGQTCTGFPAESCTVSVTSSCSCGDNVGGVFHGSQVKTVCSTPLFGSVTCNEGCADDTSCYSIPPPGCPANRVGCDWVPADDCQGGSCGVGERRVGSLYCGSTHCDDQCLADAGCGGPGPPATATPPGGPGPGSTNTPVPPSPTPTTPPTGTIRARAVAVDPSDTSCATIRAVATSPTGQVSGTLLRFTPSSASQPAPQTQSGSNYVTFGSILSGSYTIDPVAPTADWAYARACWTNENNGTTGEGLSRTLGANVTLRWDIGYTLGTAWVQTEGGDVYASGNLRSFIPAVSPRVFNIGVTDGTGNFPGIIQYGTSYDFDSDPIPNGSNYVSATRWQVNGSRTTANFYTLFYRRFGAPTIPDAFPNQNAVTSGDAPPRETPYYVVGDMTTSGNWLVNGETLVFLVDGNLTIGGDINITGDGFVAFIVNGDIAVDPSVGNSVVTSTNPNIEGVYIASNADQSAAFSTGTSIAGSPKLVGRGMFVADNFLLQRDLDSFGGNANASAEYFSYNPRLLLTMPDAMKDLAVTWQEVAP